MSLSKEILIHIFSDKAKAQEIFKSILSNKNISNKTKLLCLVSLSELNLYELKANFNNTVLEETLGYVSDILYFEILNQII